MHDERIERVLRQGPPDEPAYERSAAVAGADASYRGAVRRAGITGRSGLATLVAAAVVLLVATVVIRPLGVEGPGGAVADVLTYKVDNERTGIMPGPVLVNEPRILWQVDLDAGSAASPLVHDGEVIVATRDGRIRALDANSGQENWSLQLDAGVVWTPTIADGSLYVVTEDGVLRAIRLDDRSIAWSSDGFLDETIVTVVDDLVLAGAPGEVVALAVDDGEERWRQATGGSDRVATDGSIAYVGGDGSGTFTALAVDDGSVQWRLNLDAPRVLTPTIVEDGLVAATRADAGGNNVVLGLAADGTQRWRWEPLRRGRIAAFAVTKDHVIVASDMIDTNMQAIDIRTGDELWTTAIPGLTQMIPVVADEMVYVGGRESGVTALETTTGAIRWALPLEGAEGGGMVVTGGLLIAATQDEGGGGRVVALADPADPR